MLIGAALVFTVAVSGTSVQEPVTTSQLGATAQLSATEAMQQAQLTGSSVLVASETTESRLVRANPWGTFTAEVTPGPVRVRGRDGTWRDIDTNLVAAQDGGLVPRLTASPMRLSAGGDRTLAQITDGAASLALTWPTVLPQPTISGSSATYANVLPGVDVVVRVGAEDFATFVVVKTRQAARDPRIREIRYGLVESGVTTSTTNGEQLLVKDTSGNTLFEAGQALMWDSRGRSSTGIASEAAARGNGEGRLAKARMSVSSGQLIVTPDLSVLDDPDAVFPVVIDPAIKRYREHTYWTSVANNGFEWINSSTEMARVGYNGWESPTFVARSFYRLDTSSFVGKLIKKATFSHKLIHSPNNDCNASTFGAGVRVYSTKSGISSSTVWPGPDLSAYSPTINARAHGTSTLCSGYDRLDWDVKSIVDAAGSTLTLGMRSADEGDRNGWRKFDNDSTLNYPLLSVEYNTRPSTPGRPTLDGATGTGPSGYFTSDSTPTLRATVSDSDGTEGGQLTGLFEIYYNGSTKVTSGVGTAVNSGGTSVWTVPAGVLSQNVLYTVRVWGQDYADKSATWSDYIQFKGDWTPPAVPSVSDPDDAFVGGTTTAVISGPADAKQFCIGLNTDAVGSSCQSTSTPTVPITYTTPTLTKAGPNWITVATKDQAGLLSSLVKKYFEVKPTLPNHRWPLNNSGADAVGSVTLTPVSGTPYGDGNTFYQGDPDGDLLFNGTSQYATGSGPAVITGGGASFSVAAWVRYSPTSHIAPAAVSQLGTQAAAFYLGARNGRPALVVKTSDSSAGTNVIQHPDTANDPFSNAAINGDDGWVHLTGVYSGADKVAHLYVNGELWASAPVAGTVFNATGPVMVGRAQYNGAPADFWAGDVDDVQTFPGVVDEASLRMMMSDPEP